MRHRHPSITLAALLGIDIVFLLLAAALTPHQNPALPIELCIVLAGLTAWQLTRRSRAAATTAAVFTALLLALTLHILTGDLGNKGPRELVPDALVLVTTATGLIAALAAQRAARRRVPAT